MRAFVAITLAAIILIGGYWAISTQAQETQSNITTGPENRSYDIVTDVYNGIADTAGPGVIWFGVAAVVLVALGILVGAATGGGR